MYVFIFFVILVILFALISYFNFDNRKYDNDFSVIMGTISVISFIIVLIMTINAINPNDDYEFINYVNSTQQTINSQRVNGISEMERAAITAKIIEINQQIVSRQFKNTTSWDLWTRDTIMTLKPIQ